MSKIRKIILNLKGFQYTTSLGLNMGYYHINIKKGKQIMYYYPNMGKV